MEKIWIIWPICWGNWLPLERKKLISISQLKKVSNTFLKVPVIKNSYRRAKRKVNRKYLLNCGIGKIFLITETIKERIDISGHINNVKPM